MRTTRLSAIVLSVLLALGATGFAGCSDKDADKAGNDVEKAGKDVGNAAEDAVDEVDDNDSK